jgi:GDP-mannose transporter
MVGALNKLPIAFSGMIFFQKERDSINAGSIASILLGFMSGILYTWAQIRERKKETGPINFSKLNNSGQTSSQGDQLMIEIREQKL